MDVPPDELADEITYQIGALEVFARAAGARVGLRQAARRALQPRGRRRGAGRRRRRRASAPPARRCRCSGCPAPRCTRRRAAARLPVVAEAFADRAYTAEGTLVSRREPGAVHPRPGRGRRAPVGMARDRTVTALDGRRVAHRGPLAVLHGDTPGAAALARRVRSELAAAGVRSAALRMRALPVGEHGLLIELDTGEEVEALHAELCAGAARRHAAAGARDRAGRAHRSARRAGRSRRARRASWPAGEIPPETPATAPLVEMPVRYDGADLAEVAALWGVTARRGGPGALRRRVPGRLLRVRARLRLPDRAARALRRAAPGHTAPTVPAGSVALAGPYTGVYPRSSPGGWQLIGRTDLCCGTRPANRPRCSRPARGSASSRWSPMTARAEVVPGRSADHGPGPRPARPRAPRRAALRRARRARPPARQPARRQPRVGRHPGDDADRVRGAGPFGRHRRGDRSARPVTRGRPPGRLGRAGPGPGGRRAGGRARRARAAQLSRLRRRHRRPDRCSAAGRRPAVRPRPAPLPDGALLPLGAPHGPPARRRGAAARAARELVLPCSRARATTGSPDAALRALPAAATGWRRRATGSGCAPKAPRWSAPVSGELPSEGMCWRRPGAAGRRAAGVPADHPTTGGYPVIGVVPERDLAAAAQAVPGTPVRFLRPRGRRKR